MAELATNDIIYPPREELLCKECRNCVVITYDLETTGLCSDDEIVQIGAYAHVPSRELFSQYVLPHRRRIHVDASAKIGLQVCAGSLLDTRTNEVLPTVPEAEGLQQFLTWLSYQRADSHGVVLVSHGAIFLDIPVLMGALWRHHMQQDFFEVVKGFCDSNAIFQEDKCKRHKSLSLQSLYEDIVGPRREVHRAEGDARDLHTLLLRHFNVESLSLDIPMLERYTYTSPCMEHYAEWKLYLDVELVGLRNIVKDWKNQSERKKKIILKNLVAAGYNMQNVQREYALSESKLQFKLRLKNNIQRMKNERESYLSDTAGVHINEVVNTVVRYFTRAQQ
ncbi:uncharacterized protein [Periplaneta americana]|uniref:uncharacterized protein n=1 Tax=Periplaneta americana TaxID=6978 RepID=UPI0037E89E76